MIYALVSKQVIFVSRKSKTRREQKVSFLFLNVLPETESVFFIAGFKTSSGRQTDSWFLLNQPK